MRFAKFIFITFVLFAIVASGYLFYPRYAAYRTRVLAEEIIQPYLPSAREAVKRHIANDSADDSLIVVDNPGQRFLRIPAFPSSFSNEDSLTESEIAELGKTL